MEIIIKKIKNYFMRELSWTDAHETWSTTKEVNRTLAKSEKDDDELGIYE